MMRALLLVFFVLLFAPLAFAEPVCVVKRHVNLRRGPGVKFPVTWDVPMYMPLEKIEAKGAWFRVADLEGQKHWVLAKAVSKKKTCLVVRTKTAKLRKGPGVDQPLAPLASVDKYTPFEKTDRDGEWVQVRDAYKGSYWIHENNVWIPMARTQISF